MKEQLFPSFVLLSFLILFLITLLKKLKQPYFIAYIFAGLLLGPDLLDVVRDKETVKQIGEFGIILLLFFIGAEIDLTALARNFRRPLLVALSQAVLSILLIGMLGLYLQWDYKLIVFTSLVISISSSAIIFQYLSRTRELRSDLGMLVGGVLLVQDLMLVPMLLLLRFMAGGQVEYAELAKIAFGTLVMGIVMYLAIYRSPFRMPFGSDLASDHELQVFVGFALCFGMAWLTNWLGLSPALGAFAAGIVIGQDHSTKWLDNALIPFRIFFMAFFFIAVGLQIDLWFFRSNVLAILAVATASMVANSLINVLVFRITGSSWRDSVYAGALLSQIGEFSFILATAAFELRLVGGYAYQMALSVIAATMALTSIWIYVIQRFIYTLPKLVPRARSKGAG